MGIPRGVTMLTGGGFHGKSTLLEALELGIYNHIPGDGREQVVTDPTAVKIRGEDGGLLPYSSSCLIQFMMDSRSICLVECCTQVILGDR